MTPTELNKLPESQQRNALLAIAVGGSIAGEFPVFAAYDDDDGFIGYLDEKITPFNTIFSPEQDGELMWRLVCCLGYSPREAVWVTPAVFACEYYDKAYKTVTYAMPCETREKALIAAYLAADPKGLIEKWRKEK